MSFCLSFISCKSCACVSREWLHWTMSSNLSLLYRPTASGSQKYIFILQRQEFCVSLLTSWGHVFPSEAVEKLLQLYDAWEGSEYCPPQSLLDAILRALCKLSPKAQSLEFLRTLVDKFYTTRYVQKFSNSTLTFTCTQIQVCQFFPSLNCLRYLFSILLLLYCAVHWNFPYFIMMCIDCMRAFCRFCVLCCARLAILPLLLGLRGEV